MVPGADWITKVVTVGPPVLLVIGLLFILQAAVRDKMDIRKTALLSGIVAVFFGLWIVALPKLQTRRIAIVTSMASEDLAKEFSLRPIRYRIEIPDAEDTDLDDTDFPFPSSAGTLRLHFNLRARTNSYRDNLKTVIFVAQNDPECFEKSTRGESYSSVAAKIKELCPGSVAQAGASTSPAT